MSPQVERFEEVGKFPQKFRQLADDLVNELNQQREQNGIAHLSETKELSRAALEHARWMVTEDKYSHGDDGTEFELDKRMAAHNIIKPYA